LADAFLFAALASALSQPDPNVNLAINIRLDGDDQPKTHDWGTCLGVTIKEKHDCLTGMVCLSTHWLDCQLAILLSGS